ncbi:MAG: hypothetical protein QM597_06725 [Aeromicrobium sp.]|uniref:hypothetical protein n=1 Tax=Aeromicrobium sp. TaxID=1871063 RepID=UPI0039E31D6A
MIRYLSYSDIAARLGITTGGLGSADLPEPDALIGRARGWLPETIETWVANRPGRGRPRKPQASLSADDDA